MKAVHTKPACSCTSEKPLLIYLKALYSRCETLGLRVKCFMVQSQSLREIIKPMSFRLMSTTAPIRFGTLGEIVTNSKAGCRLCDLLLRSITNKQGDVDCGSYALSDLEPTAYARFALANPGRNTELDLHSEAVHGESSQSSLAFGSVSRNEAGHRNE
jgi:hypothetical protein